MEITKSELIKLLRSLPHFEKGYETDYGVSNYTVYIEYPDNEYMRMDMEIMVKFLESKGIIYNDNV